MTIWFTSDPHWGHSKIIEYAERKFSSIEEMDETLITNWNSIVSKKDTVYILGDFSFHKDQNKTVEIYNRLNGAEKHLILGNHDKRMKGWVKEKFTTCSPYKEINVFDESLEFKKQFIVLCHYPFRIFNKIHYNGWALHGHSHGTLPDNPTIRSIDVGVDCWDYFPVSYEQVKERMKLKTPKSVDHHKVEL